MEIFRCGLHVFAAGFLAIILIAAYAEDSGESGAKKSETWFDSDITEDGFTLQGKAKFNSDRIQVNGLHDDDDSLITESPITNEGVKSQVLDFGGEDNDNGDEDDGLLFGPPPDPEKIDPYWTKTITFRKCCAKQESFNSALKCVKSKHPIKNDDPTDAVRKQYPWFPTKVLTGSHVVETVPASMLKVTRIKVKYSSMPKCGESERIVLQWHKEDAPFYFIFVSNGSIVEINTKHFSTIGIWPVDSYCLDAVSSQNSYHVVYFCPCIHRTCVRKCCPGNLYFNATSENCIKNKDANKNYDYKPKFFAQKKPITKNVTYYVLRIPFHCTGKKIEWLNPRGSKKKHPLYIQKDGSLLVFNDKKTLTIKISQYCADVFLEAPGKITTNAHYCVRKKRLYQHIIYNDVRLHKSDGEFFSANFLLFVTALLFVVIYE